MRLRVCDAFAMHSRRSRAARSASSTSTLRGAAGTYVETGRMLAPNKLDVLCGFDGGAAQPGGRFAAGAAREQMAAALRDWCRTTGDSWPNPSVR